VCSVAAFVSMPIHRARPSEWLELSTTAEVRECAGVASRPEVYREVEHATSDSRKGYRNITAASCPAHIIRDRRATCGPPACTPHPRRHHHGHSQPLPTASFHRTHTQLQKCVRRANSCTDYCIMIGLHLNAFGTYASIMIDVRLSSLELHGMSTLQDLRLAVLIGLHDGNFVASVS